MIEKKDWQNALKQYEAMLINSSVSIAAYQFMIDKCEEEIKKFPEEDPMPEDIKEIAKEVTK